MIDPISTPTSIAPAESRNSPARIENAAKQFEALLMGQILKSMHEEGSNGWLGGGDDQSGESAMQLAEEQFAQALSSRGGLGLAKVITQGLSAQSKR
jgi:peptidoglycan hydrolase FlgJ